MKFIPIVAAACIMSSTPKSAICSYVLQNAATNDIYLKKKVGDWNPNTDEYTLKEIQLNIEAKRPLLKNKKIRKRYCAGIPSNNQPMYINSCNLIGITKADQSLMYYLNENQHKK